MKSPSVCRAGLLIVGLFSLCLSSVLLVAGQTTLDEVHVVAGAAAASAPASVAMVQPQPIRKNVDLVLVPVTITDWANRLVVGLEKGVFQLFEGSKRQEIRHFSSEDGPASIGILFDSSKSMASKVARAREAVIEFCRTANPEDEFFFIAFADRPEMQQPFTSRVEDIQGRLALAIPNGSTALLDAIYLGLTQMKRAKYAKRALLIISDGGDNHSRYGEREVKALAKEADVTIYGMGIYDRYFSSSEEALGPLLMNEIATVTGGSMFQVENPNDLPAIAARISMELRRQYVLGYRPENAPNDGKWHKIKVKVRVPKGLPPLLVHAKAGYYAATR